MFTSPAGSGIFNKLDGKEDLAVQITMTRQAGGTVAGQITARTMFSYGLNITRAGDDEVIRANALTVLAGTGLRLAAPLLADAQDSAHPLEAAAARKGLAILADRLGPDAVETALRPGQRLAAPLERTGGETAPDAD